MKLLPEEKKLLECLADTFFAAEENGSAFRKLKGSQVVDLSLIEQALEAQPAKAQKEFRQLLQLLQSPVAGVFAGVGMKSFEGLRQTEREKLLRRWSGSLLPPLRKAFLSLKKLLLFLAYAHSSEDKPNPCWQAIGYPGPSAQAANAQEALPVLKPFTETTYRCHTLVIGSGAGGGLVAGELAAAGYDVLVVDKGPYLTPAQLSQREAEMVGKLYEGRGALTTTDGAITLFAGSCLGGGTAINWAGSFSPPAWLRHEWAQAYALPELESADFQQSVDAVLAKLSVRTYPDQHNSQNQKLRDGSSRLGQQVKDIPRNEAIPEGESHEQSGFSGFGDRFGHKQSTIKTYLKEAVQHGARLLPDTRIDRLLIRQGKVIGAEGVVQGDNPIPISIQAERVVLAAGALHSPALLMRSGLRHPHLGRHLKLHPTVAVSGLYNETINSWHGPMMSAVNDTFSQIQDHWGVKLETPPTHSGLLALALPWKSSQQHKTYMASAARLASFIVLTRDKHGGEVKVDKAGKLHVNYRLHRFDRAHMLRGMQEAARIHAAAGAHEILFPHNALKRWQQGEDLEACLKQLPGWGWQPNRFALFSAHQMGTVRMGGNKKQAPVAPNGSFRGIKGLYLADASLFPSASGVNPMITIMALAHRIAQGLK